jgi:hypothetical protein
MTFSGADIQFFDINYMNIYVKKRKIELDDNIIVLWLRNAMGRQKQTGPGRSVS